MIIVGGTYSEICFEPISEDIFGSGLRAVSLVLENNNTEDLIFYTCADEEVQNHLNYYTNIYSSLTVITEQVFESPKFHYDFPLKTPSIFPRPDLYRDVDVLLETKGDNILVFGLLEASIKVEGEKVVYDPQSPVNPIPFSKTGSSAKKLITIINQSEARKITGCTEISKIREYFFIQESCFALILKMGAKGALLFNSATDEPIIIPVYKTNKVWPIGSGDVFSANFAMNWFNGIDLVESATLASKATACYCDTRNLITNNRFSSFEYPTLSVKEVPQDMIYLAGPFFTFGERWIINEVLNSLRGFGLKVFSPFHDVGQRIRQI